MKKPKIQFMTPGGSLGIFALGVLLQVILYPLSVAIIIPFNNHPVVEPIILGVMTLIFFMPLLGVLGMIVGVKCYHRKIGRFLPFFGIILNIFWLAALGIACYLTFVMKITV